MEKSNSIPEICHFFPCKDFAQNATTLAEIRSVDDMCIPLSNVVIVRGLYSCLVVGCKSVKDEIKDIDRANTRSVHMAFLTLPF